MGCWSDLHEDLLREISRRLMVTADRIRFSAVCKSWEFFATTSELNFLPPRPPWLMLAENPAGGSRRGFVGLGGDDKKEEEEVVFELDFPESSGKRCVGSTGTWVITVDVKFDMHLLNPFTKHQFELPSLSAFDRFDRLDSDENISTALNLRNGFVEKAVLWWPPEKKKKDKEEQDFVVMTMYSCHTFLAFTRRGSKSWTKVKMDFRPYFRDVIFYKPRGKFYAVTFKGVVIECNIDFDNNGHGGETSTVQVVSSPLKQAELHYLVEWSGKLLQILRFVDHTKHHHDHKDVWSYQTSRFEVFELDFDSGQWTQLKSLGQHSLFLGANTSVALLAVEEDLSTTTFNGNCIYFTDNCREGYKGNGIEGGKDMGVFYLENGSIRPHYKGVSLCFFSPPLWIIPSNFSC